MRQRYRRLGVAALAAITSLIALIGVPPDSALAGLPGDNCAAGCAAACPN